LVLLVLLARPPGLWMGLARGRDRIIDRAPILAWRRADPDAAVGPAPAHHPRPLLLGYRVHTLLCRGAGLPLLFRRPTAKVHDAPFARPLHEWARCLLVRRPRVIRLDVGSWGAETDHPDPHHPGRGGSHPVEPQAAEAKRRDGLPPTWAADERRKRTRIERVFGRVRVVFRLRRPPVFGRSAVETRVSPTSAAVRVMVMALVAWQECRPDVIRSPRSVLAHVWEGVGG
jgi:hypothetical protein